MTYYYYLASDKEMDSLDDSIHAAKSNIENHVGPIPGFDYPVQIEISMESMRNGQHKSYCNIFAPYKICTVQVTNLINSNRTKLAAQMIHKQLLHKVIDPQQLLLKEGDLLIIKKIIYFCYTYIQQNHPINRLDCEISTEVMSNAKTDKSINCYCFANCCGMLQFFYRE